MVEVTRSSIPHSRAAPAALYAAGNVCARVAGADLAKTHVAVGQEWVHRWRLSVYACAVKQERESPSYAPIVVVVAASFILMLWYATSKFVPYIWLFDRGI